MARLGRAAALLLLFPTLAAASAREVRLVMGTTAEIAAEGAADDAAALDAAFQALTRVDDLLSLWKESPLTRLNRDAGGASFPELLDVVRCALDVAAASGGAFDPTVEPLLRAAGDYGEVKRALPEGERRQLLSRVGYRRVRLGAGSVQLEPGTGLDLGGIAKGYAVDQALCALRAAGARRAVVSLGGSSLGALGVPLTVDVRDPEAAGAPLASFVVEKGGIASSGGDQKPGHILDPRTGHPAAGVLGASVVAPTAMEADALATAVFVLGAEAGLALLQAWGAEGLVVARAGKHLALRTTRGFAARHALLVRPDVKLAP